MRSYSFYVRDQWQVTNRMTVSFGTRYEYFPMPTRDGRGLERYNPETNMMEIGGIGSVPTDLGISMEKGLFAPRVGVTFRASPTMVLRGGFGITNDPYSLARPMRTNHPVLLNLIVNAPNTFSWAGRTADGVPPVPNADLGNGIIPIPSNVSAIHDSERVQPRLHQVVERGDSEGAEVGVRRRSGVRRHAADRPARGSWS